jgi:hypothetical protein
VLEAAVGARGGRVTLSNPEDKSWAFQTRRVESAEQGVDICTVDQAVKLVGEKARLFIAKIDIEGFESDLFEENLGWLDQADVVIIEPHDWMLPGKDSSLNFRRALMGRPGDMLIAGENLIFIASRLTAADR